MQLHALLSEFDGWEELGWEKSRARAAWRDWETRDKSKDVLTLDPSRSSEPTTEATADQRAGPRRFAYADPPYLGYCRYYDHFHPDGRCWDDLATHRALVERLTADYPDGWAMSLSMPSLRDIWPMTPSDTRVLTWCKSFASFKPGIHPAYATEPVIIRGARKRDRDEPTVSDFWVGRITLEKGLTGVKPQGFVWWLLAALNAKADDELVDLFPGSGAVGRAWDAWRAQAPLGLVG